MNKAVLFLSLVVVLFACETDSIEEIQPNFRVNASFNGLIVDEAGAPMKGVAVEVEGSSVITGSSGTFVLKNVDVPVSNTYLKAVKPGYFNGSRTIQPIEDQQNTIRIMLLEKELTGTVDAETGGIVELENGTSVELPPGGVIMQSGADFTGVIEVYMKHLSPANTDMSDQMPGDLIGIDVAGDEKLLESFGMIAIELRSETGETLKLRDDVSSEIRIQVDDTLASSAPASISLWHFDESMGIWQEESSADFNGTHYVGQVGHFSFWNVVMGIPLINLSGNILLGDLPYAGTTVQVRRLAAGLNNNRYEYTNPEGGFSGPVPANELLEISVLDLCGELLSTQMIGPFIQDHKLDPISVSDEVNQLSVTGHMLNCEGEPLNEAFILIRVGQKVQTYYQDASSIDVIFRDCSSLDSLEVRVVDVHGEAESGWQREVVNYDNVNLGTVLTCEDLLVNEFISYEFKGQAGVLWQSIINEVHFFDNEHFDSLSTIVFEASNEVLNENQVETLKIGIQDQSLEGGYGNGFFDLTFVLWHGGASGSQGGEGQLSIRRMGDPGDYFIADYIGIHVDQITSEVDTLFAEIRFIVDE